MHESEKWKWSHSVVSDPQWPHGLQPMRLLRPWDFPGKSTEVGCHWVCCYLHAIINMLWYKHIIQPQFYDKKATAHNFSVCKKFTLRVQVFKFKLNLSDCIRSKNNGWGIIGTLAFEVSFTITSSNPACVLHEGLDYHFHKDWGPTTQLLLLWQFSHYSR